MLTPDRVPLLDGFAIGTRSLSRPLGHAGDRGAVADRRPDARGCAAPASTTRAEIAIAGLPDSFWGEWAANHALFPCGVDLVFTAGAELLALPRSIAVEA